MRCPGSCLPRTKRHRTRICPEGAADTSPGQARPASAALGDINGDRIALSGPRNLHDSLGISRNLFSPAPPGQTGIVGILTRGGARRASLPRAGIHQPFRRKNGTNLMLRDLQGHRNPANMDTNTNGPSMRGRRSSYLFPNVLLGEGDFMAIQKCSELILDLRSTLLGAEDEVDEVFGEGLGHGVFPHDHFLARYLSNSRRESNCRCRYRTSRVPVPFL